MKAYNVLVGDVYRFSDKMLEKNPQLHKGTYTRTKYGSVRDDGVELIYTEECRGHPRADVTVVSDMEVCV